jgi:cysteine desulfuration protein SufE
LNASPATAAATTSLAERLAALRARLTAVRDPQARLSQLVEQARCRPHLPVPLRLEVHRVAGCQVRLWLVPEFRAGRCRFQTDSDAVTLRAMVGVLCELTDDLAPAEVATFEFGFLEELGLLRQLAESRRATVLRVAEQIRDFGRSQLVTVSSP